MLVFFVDDPDEPEVPVARFKLDGDHVEAEFLDPDFEKMIESLGVTPDNGSAYLERIRAVVGRSSRFVIDEDT